MESSQLCAQGIGKITSAQCKRVTVPSIVPGLDAFRHRRALYTRGTEVRILIKELELSKTFLGYDREVTLMEADAVLLGLHNANNQDKDRES